VLLLPWWTCFWPWSWSFSQDRLANAVGPCVVSLWNVPRGSASATNTTSAASATIATPALVDAATATAAAAAALPAHTTPTDAATVLSPSLTTTQSHAPAAEVVPRTTEAATDVAMSSTAPRCSDAATKPPVVNLHALHLHQELLHHWWEYVGLATRVHSSGLRSTLALCDAAAVALASVSATAPAPTLVTPGAPSSTLATPMPHKTERTTAKAATTTLVATTAAPAKASATSTSAGAPSTSLGYDRDRVRVRDDDGGHDPARVVWTHARKRSLAHSAAPWSAAVATRLRRVRVGLRSRPARMGCKLYAQRFERVLSVSGHRFLPLYNVMFDRGCRTFITGADDGYVACGECPAVCFVPCAVPVLC